MNLFEELLKKFENVNFEYEIKESPISDMKSVIFYVQKERERERLTISEGNKDFEEIFNSNFEKYRFLKGFEGIWSSDLKCIECEVESEGPLSRNLLQVLHKLLTEDKAKDLTNNIGEIQDSEIDEGNESNSNKLTLYTSNNVEINIGYCSKDFAICTSLKSLPISFGRVMDRIITLQIKGLDIGTHNEALQYLLKISNSLFFQINRLLYSPVKLRSERENRYERMKRDRKRQNLESSLSYSKLLKYEYDNEPMSLYIHGKSSGDLPLNQFLSFYQTIEYYFPFYSNVEAKQKIKRLLKDPLFDPNNDTKITKILSLVQANRSGEVGDEKSQLKATVRNCVEDMDLREFIEGDEERKEYFEKNNGKKLSACGVNIKAKNNDIVHEVCERIYDIRCKIVHKKANGYNGELILPYSPEIKNIKHDINLVEFVAQKILIENSRTLDFSRLT